MTNEQMIHENKALIDNEARKYPHIPFHVMQIESYKIARNAAKSYNKTSGVKFSTHLTNQLKQLSRISTQYGNIIRIPENKQYQINKLNQVESHLESEFGRMPTVAEMADSTGFGLGVVNNLLKRRKKEISVNNIASNQLFDSGASDDWVHYVYHDLPARDKLIFEHKVGFGNRPILGNVDIGKKLALSTKIVDQRVKMITKKLEEGMHV